MMKFPDFIDGQTVMAKVRYKSRPGFAYIYHVDPNELSESSDCLNRPTNPNSPTSPNSQTKDLNNSSFLIPHSSLVRIVFENDIESITPGHQASLSITNSWSPPKPMSIVSVMSSNHLILCCPLLLLPSIFPRIRVFSNESALCISGQSTGVSASTSVPPMNTQD